MRIICTILSEPPVKSNKMFPSRGTMMIGAQYSVTQPSLVLGSSQWSLISSSCCNIMYSTGETYLTKPLLDHLKNCGLLLPYPGLQKSDKFKPELCAFCKACDLVQVRVS